MGFSFFFFLISKGLCFFDPAPSRAWTSPVAKFRPRYFGANLLMSSWHEESSFARLDLGGRKNRWVYGPGGMRTSGDFVFCLFSFFIAFLRDLLLVFFLEQIQFISFPPFSAAFSFGNRHWFCQYGFAHVAMLCFRSWRVLKCFFVARRKHGGVQVITKTNPTPMENLGFS